MLIYVYGLSEVDYQSGDLVWTCVLVRRHFLIK